MAAHTLCALTDPAKTTYNRHIKREHLERQMKPIRFILSMIVTALISFMGVIHLERGDNMGALVMFLCAVGMVAQAVIHATLADE